MKTKSVFYNTFFIGIFLSSIIFSPFILDFTLTPRLISMSVVLLCVVYLWFKHTKPNIVKFDFIVLSYIAYIVWSCLTGLWANTLTEVVFENTKLLVSLGVFLTSYYFFKQDKERAIITLCKISCAIVFIECVFVGFQLSQLTVFNKEALYSVYGINSHKNLVSSYLYLNLFFLVIGLFRIQKLWKWITILALLLTIAIIIVLQTKAVWVALVISILLALIILVYKRLQISFNVKWTLIVSVILVNVFFVFVQPKIIKKGLAFNVEKSNTTIQAQKQELDNERLQLWDKTYDMIHAHPLLGVGAGNWQIQFPNATLKGMYRAEDLNFTFQRPHNDVLWIIAETGFIGFTIYLVFVLALIVFLLKSIKTISSKQIGIELTLTIIAIIGFFTASFFDFPKERMEHLIWIYVVFGFAYYLIKQTHTIEPLIQWKLSKLHSRFLQLSLLAIIGVAVYRYQGEFYTRKMYDQKRLGNNSGIIKFAKKATNVVYSIDPTSLPISWYTGNAYAILGNFAQAKTDFKNAYTLNPYNRNVINDLASAYVNTQQLDSAKYYYLEAIRISPRFDDPKLNLAAVYFNQQQFVKADSCLHTLLHDSEKRTKYQTMVNAFLGK